MFMMAKNFDEAKKMLNVAMAEKYPDTFSIAIFIDDGIKRGFCTENSIDEIQIKKTLTACYQSALDVLNDYSEKSKDENGIKLTIKKEDKKLNIKDYVLTDDEIKDFATDFVKYVKDVLTENYKSGKTHGDYHTGCHFGYGDMVDAATYGANAVYDLMMKKIMDSGACKECEKQTNNKRKRLITVPDNIKIEDMKKIFIIMNNHRYEFEDVINNDNCFVITNASEHLCDLINPIIDKNLTKPYF